jgi:two-component system, OmpR family, response regulator
VIANPETIPQQKRSSVAGNRARAFQVRWTFQVLIVTPHQQQRIQLEQALRGVGYCTVNLERTQDVQAFLRREPCDAMILDLDQLNADQTRTSLQHFHDLRLSGLQLPTMILGNGLGLEQRIAAFDAGGDDFQAKPVVEEEVLVRLRSILRRTNPHLALNLDWRGLHMNWASRIASVNGQRLSLNLNEFTLFEVLASIPGRIISPRELRPHLEITSETSLNEVVSGLHAKLGMNVIETVSGEGYRFPPGD